MSDQQTNGKALRQETEEPEIVIPPRTTEEKRRFAELIWKRNEQAHRELAKH